MKKLIAIGMFVLAGCSSPESGSKPITREEIDWAAEGKLGVDLLQRLIRSDTINPPPAGAKKWNGEEKKNAEETALLVDVKGELAHAGIESQIYESAPGRGNLVARIRGKGGKRPLLLLAHVDVVSVEPKMWSVDPLSATVKDGCVWGRGALDDKGWAACAIAAMRILAQHGPKLDRDVVLMLNADEESSGHFGAQFMLKNHAELLDCEFVLNEGGKTTLENGKVATVGVQSAEKVYNDFRLWIRGVSGHSSVPVKKNAIYEVSRLLAKLEGFEMPLEVQPTPAAWLEALSHLPSQASQRDVLKSAAKGNLEAAAKLAESPAFNSQLRSTFVPTIVKGGIRENVLPPDVEVNFNARLLPGTKLDDVIRAIAQRIGLETYEIVDVKPEGIADWKAKNPDKGAAFFVVERDLDAPASPLNTPLTEAIRKAAHELVPGAAVVPEMSAGATDSRFFRARGVTCYGIHPCPTTDEERTTVHNHNERVRVESVSWGVRFLYQIVSELGR